MGEREREREKRGGGQEAKKKGRRPLDMSTLKAVIQTYMFNLKSHSRLI